MTQALNRQWRFASYPQGRYRSSDFQWCEVALPQLAPGQVRVRNVLLSLDPTNRAWGADEDTYLPRMVPGEVMRGLGIGIVDESRNPLFPVGAYVTGLIGWQDYQITDGAPVDGIATLSLLPRDAAVPLSAYLGLFGFIGLTAYRGLFHHGRPVAGDTVLVSAAAGATGSLVGQLARIAGCRAVGIAGGAQKCARLLEEFGFDAAIDYRDGELDAALARVCPDGVDVYYDNVGGAMLETVLDHINRDARVVIAGQIAAYNDEGTAGPRNLLQLIMKRAHMEGFVVLDALADPAYVTRAMTRLTQWYRDGQLRYRTHIVDGLEAAPEAINMLFEGANEGKLMVKIAADPGGQI